MGIFICYYYILYVVQYSTYFLVHLYIILWYNTAQTGGTDPYCTYCPCSLESSFVPSTQRVKGRTYVRQYCLVLSCLVHYPFLCGFRDDDYWGSIPMDAKYLFIMCWRAVTGTTYLDLAGCWAVTHVESGSMTVSPLTLTKKAMDWRRLTLTGGPPLPLGMITRCRVDTHLSRNR